MTEMTERVQTLINDANNATTLAQFQKVYRAAKAMQDAEPFAEDEKVALGAAFSAVVSRLVSL